MSINLELPKLTELKPRIVVIGVGGAGGNAINNMIASGLTGVEYIAANTDAQALIGSSAERRIQLGANLTEGLGAGSKPEIGQAAAEEAIEEIRQQIGSAHMVFIAAGMGGGTGTGAAAVIARTAREMGVLTVGIVTKPFMFEGTRRLRMAEAGIAELKKYVDTLIVIPNQNLFRIATEKTTFAEAFVLADQVLYSGVACIVDLIIKDGLINLDFADVRTVMSGMGTAMMGTGEATGESRALKAAEEAISNPLLDEVTLKGAKGVLLSIIGGRDMTLYEVDEAASRVRQEVDPEANIIVGATFDDALGDSIRVAIVASGLVTGAGGQAAGGPGQSGHRARALDASQPPPMPPLPPAPPLPSQHAGTANGAQAQGLPYAIDQAVNATRQPEPPQPRTDIGGGRPPYGQTPHGEPRELWRSPGNVVIEEARPPRLQNASAHGQGMPAPAAQSATPDTFRPAPPEDMRRPAPRRLPELEEFPAVGQRDYRAKTGQYETPPSNSGHRKPDASADAESPQRAGLLHRMMNVGRRSDSSADVHDDNKRGSSGTLLPVFFNKNKS